MPTVYHTNSTEETVKAGEEFGKTLVAGAAVLFRGEMGAGKTHFTKGIAKALGIKDDVTSPTFAVVSEYFGRLTLFHFDLFRIPSYDDLYAIGFFDYIDRCGVMVIEWSENIKGLCDEFDCVYIVSIEITGEESRKITIDASGDKKTLGF